MSIFLDLERHGDVKTELRERFLNAEPFPHIVIDNFLHQEDAEKLLEEHKVVDDWGSYIHVNEHKKGLTNIEKMGQHTQEVIKALSSDAFLKWLGDLSGIDHLISDPDLDGGGLHKISPGGYLNIHVDYLAHTTHPSWSRQINFLLYLNKDWKPEWDGGLEIWDADMKNKVSTVEPIFNRCVMFNTRRRSFHGHPLPLKCPEGEARRSLALYYFRDEEKPLALEPTLYKARPQDSTLKHILVWADCKAVRVYSALKRHLGLKDGVIQSIMKRF